MILHELAVPLGIIAAGIWGFNMGLMYNDLGRIP